MGIELCFYYEADDKTQFITPQRVVYLGEPFEVPDLLVKVKSFESLEAAEAAGFLPGFVKQYREEMGSHLGYVLTTPKEERRKNSDKYQKDFFANLNAGGNPADFGDEAEFCSIPASAAEVEAWAGKWLAVLNEETLSEPEVLRFFLPYSHDRAATVVEDLESVRAQAVEALSKGISLRLEAWYG